MTHKFVYTFLIGSLMICTAGCGASSFHTPASPASPTTETPTAGPATVDQGTTAHRYAIDQKPVSEDEFNQALVSLLARKKMSFDFKKLSVAESKLTQDYKWVFAGDSGEMQISGEVCKEGQVVLQATSSQGQLARVLTAAAGTVIPYRVGKTRTLVEMPTVYEDPQGVLARGTSKLQPADVAPSLTALLSSANKDVSFNLGIEDLKFTLSVLKPTAKSQYLVIQAEYTPSECIGR